VRPRITLAVVIASVLAGAFFPGCGPEKTVEIRYQRQPQYEVSPRIKRLGIAQFGGKTATDRKWGDVASDRLAAALDEYNRKFKRYELVDRKRLKAILDERDLQLMISDGASATQAGKLANVDAMIYGSVSVNARDERAHRAAFDPLRRGMKTVYYTKRYVLTAVTFTMDDIKTGKQIVTVSTTREYDSEKDDESGGAKVGKALGFGGGDLPPTDQLVSHLIDECVQEFLSKISPHEVVVTEKLQKGKRKAVDTGNKLAAAGDYAEALECYRQAIRTHPDDHGAVFNAGVMYEAQADLKQAEAHYDKAFKMEPEEQYVLARKRVRLAEQH